MTTGIFWSGFAAGGWGVAVGSGEGVGRGGIIGVGDCEGTEGTSWATAEDTKNNRHETTVGHLICECITGVFG
jgi:hypothetical protein